MKNLLITSFLLIIFSFSAPLIIAKPIESLPDAAERNKPAPSASPALSSSPDGRIIKLSRGGAVLSISFSEYLTGVVAAEMPASFGIEALKAQAVASRTYALYNINHKKHAGFDLCADPACCSAYADHNSLREKWGPNFDAYYSKVKSAVESTDGIYLTWEGEPILAAFHSSSYGSTESSENVWSSALPYLRSVQSPETADKVTNLFTTVKVSLKDFRETLSKKYPSAEFGPDPAKWISSLMYSEGGRVSELVAGGVRLSGAELRQLFGLRSAAFTYRLEKDAVVFSVAGYGHGVGLSQYGANIMASKGSSYEQILKYYYSGVQISRLSDSAKP